MTVAFFPNAYTSNILEANPPAGTGGITSTYESIGAYTMRGGRKRAVSKKHNPVSKKRKTKRRINRRKSNSRKIR
jgi:hypothetical protein